MSLTQNIEYGRGVNYGYIAGVFLFETKPSAITEANAALQATWDAMAVLTQTNRLMHLRFDQVEPGEDTPNEVEYANGTKDIADISRGVNKFQIKSSLAAKSALYGQLKTGADLYAIYYTSYGYLIGKEVTTPNTIEAIKTRLSASISQAAPKGVGYDNIYMTYLENWEEFSTYIKLETGFDPQTLETVKTMTFTATDDTLTTLTVSVKDLDKVGVTDLNVTGAGNFVLTNTTGGAPVTVTGITRTGSSYVLAFAAQTEGNAWSLSYGEPDATSELWDLKATITGTFTAA